MSAASGRLAEALLQALDEATSRFHADDAQSGRQGAIDALCAQIRFIDAEVEAKHKRGASATELARIERSKEPLLALASALDELERGIVAPILRPTNTGGNKTLPEFTKLGRAAAAAAMDALIHAGMSRKDAAKFVAKRLSQSADIWAGIRKRDPWQAVAHWRDDLVKRLKDAPPHARDTTLFQDYTTPVRSLVANGQGALPAIQEWAGGMLRGGEWMRDSTISRAKVERPIP